jgi:hypothetical protein
VRDAGLVSKASKVLENRESGFAPFGFGDTPEEPDFIGNENRHIHRQCAHCERRMLLFADDPACCTILHPAEMTLRSPSLPPPCHPGYDAVGA